MPESELKVDCEGVCMTNQYSQLDEYKIKASRLLKQFRVADGQSSQAAARFQQLPQFANLTFADIVRKKDNIRRKHALAVIAQENGYASWGELKHQVSRQEKRMQFRANWDETLFYPEHCIGFINEWYVSYEEARESLEKSGGYLLPYQNHFFLCQREYISVLGLDPDDPDWVLINFDWVRPVDQAARGRLEQALLRISEGR